MEHENDKDRRMSAGMLMAPAKNAYMPCQLEVRSSDRLPLDIVTPHPVADGRYQLLAPGWEGEVVRINGGWQIGKLSRKLAKDPKEIQSLSASERKQRDAELAKRLKLFGKDVAKNFFKERSRDDDRER